MSEPGPKPGPEPAHELDQRRAASLHDTVPWHDRRLWMVQIVVLALYVARLAVELHLTRARAPVPGIPDFTTLGLFLWPVLYAAVVTGPAGGALTAAWVAMLSVPRDLAFLGGGDPVAVWAESTQVVALAVVAVVVGQQVAAERRARVAVDEARRAHLAAEARYRSLFDASESPTVLVQRPGRVVEANAAAVALHGGRPDSLAELVGTGAAQACVGQAADLGVGGRPIRADLGTVVVHTGSRRQFRLSASELGAEGDGLVQVVLTDVTAETERREVAELFAQAMVDAQEEERRHLAQELHDGPLQSLVHLVRQLDGSPALAGLRSTGVDLVDELRRIARGLRPSVLDDLGLVAAVGRLVEDVGARSAINATMGVTGSVVRLAAPVELALFRVAQQALANAERHGAPTRVAVGIAFEPERIRLLVTDDGRGFDVTGPASRRRQGALGLIGMAERLHLAGGEVAVHSEPGAGTTVEAVVPTSGPSGTAHEPGGIT